MTRYLSRALAGAGMTAALGLGVLAPPASASTAPQTPEPLIVGFGDSVPSAERCACPGMLDYYGDLVATARGAEVSVENESRAGATSSSLLAQMSDEQVQEAVRSAAVVVIMVGANDFGAAFRSVSNGADADEKYGPVADRLRANLRSIITEVHSLRPGIPVLVCDYWNDFKDGSVARRVYTDRQRAAAHSATAYTNDAIKDAAAATAATYVSTYGPFYHHGDMTDLLASDGDHPNSAGHHLIAQALFSALPMTPPPSSSAPDEKTTPAPDDKAAPDQH